MSAAPANKPYQTKQQDEKERQNALKAMLKAETETFMAPVRDTLAALADFTFNDSKGQETTFRVEKSPGYFFQFSFDVMPVPAAEKRNLFIEGPIFTVEKKRGDAAADVYSGDHHEIAGRDDRPRSGAPAKGTAKTSGIMIGSPGEIIARTFANAVRKEQLVTEDKAADINTSLVSWAKEQVKALGGKEALKALDAHLKPKSGTGGAKPAA
jgi:hypothetical protein